MNKTRIDWVQVARIGTRASCRVALCFAALGTINVSYGQERASSYRQNALTVPRAPGAYATMAQASKTTGRASSTQTADLDALIRAAKAEGELTYYAAPTENVARRVSNAFAAKYGIKAPFVRMVMSTLLPRYATEAETGNIAADLVLLVGASSVVFAEQSIKKGWAESVSEAGLPTIKSGEFPANFNKGATALIQINPWIITFNTEKVRKGESPKDWLDILNPKYKGQVLIADPRVSDALLEFWTMLLDKHGESFFTRLQAQTPRQFSSGVPAIQALAAGEGAVNIPAIVPLMQLVKGKGAPLDMVTPDFTTGLEGHLMLTARGKAKHPNAARLFANYIMSPEGNAVMNDDPGGFAVYDTLRLPKQYISPRPDASINKDRLAKLLGFQ